jgi:predicted Zn-dependent protease
VAKVTTPAGRREMRFAVVYWDNKAYIFAGAVDERANIAVYDTAFLDTIRSFHPIGPREQGLMTPLRIHLATVTPGMSFQALARESPLPNDAEAQLRLLNGRYPAGEPQPGEVLKLIR